MLILVLCLPACQSFVFNYTVAVLHGSLLFTCCVCQHCNKGLLLLLLCYVVIPDDVDKFATSFVLLVAAVGASPFTCHNGRLTAVLPVPDPVERMVKRFDAYNPPLCNQTRYTVTTLFAPVWSSFWENVNVTFFPLLGNISTYHSITSALKISSHPHQNQKIPIILLTRSHRISDFIVVVVSLYLLCVFFCSFLNFLWKFCSALLLLSINDICNVYIKHRLNALLTKITLTLARKLKLFGTFHITNTSQLATDSTSSFIVGHHVDQRQSLCSSDWTTTKINTAKRRRDAKRRRRVEWYHVTMSRDTRQSVTWPQCRRTAIDYCKKTNKQTHVHQHNQRALIEYEPTRRIAVNPNVDLATQNHVTCRISQGHSLYQVLTLWDH